MINIITKFYIDGFKHISELGLRLWLLIIIKLVIMFAILKIFFFENFLDTKFENDQEKSNYIIEQLT